MMMHGEEDALLNSLMRGMRMNDDGQEVAAACGIVEAVGIVAVEDRRILRRSIFDLEKQK